MNLFNKYYGSALLAGAMCVFGFAPFGIYAIPVLALAVLFSLWLHADSARTAAWLGFAFGLGLFSAGIGWIYIAMYEYGDMPLLLALLATLLFAAFWALLPALAGYVQARFPVANWLRIMLVMPAVWALLEWFRGLLVTGFPWLTLGYAHSDNPLAGYAPLLGVYGVSLAAAASAGSLLLLWRSRWSKQGKLALILLFSIWGLGALLRAVAWTQPQGEPFSVALVQGNIPQNLKFNEDVLVGTLETYRRLVEQNPARLTVLPETALPLHRHEVPQSLIEKLHDHARQNGGDVLIGAFERNNGSYYNSVFSLGVADEQHYRKQHLVPFGEFIPLRPLFGWLINRVLDIPMGDLARGDAIQAPLAVAGQQVAVNICYEDVFGEEIIRSLPQATLLVNVTNDAWYGNSPVAAQHNQIAQLRALETGRMMLRATNTGVTSIIGADGKVLQQLPQHKEAVLLGKAQGYDGITPYVRWGNAAVLLLLVAMLAYAWLRRKT
ncbi:MAG: apolipoprotein N-acyltransferase, partial [Nitrosomonadales bacterium]|nr:apolipoprotein N-acyltransferase [Nitrosomonadales bacterium]